MKTFIVNGKFFTQSITGVQRYARELMAEVDLQLGNYSDIQMILAIPKSVKEIPVYKNIQVECVGHLNGLLWEQISLPVYAFHRGCLLNLCNVSPILSPGIVCIHDVKIKARPQDFSRAFLLWYNLLFLNATHRAKKIITVSTFSKKEIVKYYKIKSDKVTVIPDAWQHYNHIKYDEGALEKYGLKKNRYYFSMSSLEPNKNFRWIAEVAMKSPNQTFAVAGSINKKVFANGFGFECPNNMKLLGYISDEEAKTLSRYCKAFLFPTYYEGFGIPPLEAISAGASQIIVSDTEVMHEIFEDNASYVNPNKYEVDLDILDYRAIDRNNCLSRYSWEKSSRKLLEVLRDQT